MARQSKKQEIDEKEQAYNELKGELLADLERRGLVNRAYTDKVDEYMTLWLMFCDIKNNPYAAADHKMMTLLLNTSRQMLAIWGALGFRDIAKKAQAVSTEDEEL